ncbi:sigma-70 family RNA polymerase sigma factor [Alicyclobacillus ferrooxydans]|uniref:RNA polymerase subunit sigma-24 n=1 Tax=Alicyclobacillus ferrooxydans TaxID=471514 RepID=A0A0P9EJZ1_9BACL|nr:sigma-70 family RNA polymerase sigma factor [Alicyclobacillus ferrooxydans]KPV43351.1 hypothetical protein AN477_12955 [Alicyclobacillus ferrooxydans]
MIAEDQRKIIAEWMTLYGSAVWAYVYAITQDHTLTDDLSQEVFIQAYLKLPTFRGQSAAKTWLFAIARNKARDYFKSALRRRVFPTASMVEQKVGTSPSAEDEVLKYFESHQLAQAVFELKPIYREVILLHVKESLTFREISEITGSSESAVKVRFQRALQMLRKKVEKEGTFHGIRRQDSF